jgi:hypothetical protein
VQVFLSCSSRVEDEEVVRFFKSVCTGLGLRTVTVDTASPSVPPAEARRLMSQSMGVVAVATRRDRLTSTEYAMPSAVREEVAMAYGLQAPLLPIVEDGVRIDGMFANFATALRFDRDRLAVPDRLEKVIRAISSFKDIIQQTNGASEAPCGYYSEQTKRLLSLEQRNDGYVWVNVTSKRLRFDEDFSGSLRKRTRPGYYVRPEGPPVPMTWSVHVDGGSQSFEITPVVLAITGDTLDLELHIDPSPMVGDFLEFTTRIESPDLNPIYVSEPLPPMLHLGERDHGITDGMVPIEQTRVLIQQWHFPSAYGLRVNDLKPFVATYSFGTDFASREELVRTKVVPRSFDGKVVVDMEIRDPLMRHMYGIAWNPPKAPAKRAEREGDQP